MLLDSGTPDHLFTTDATVEAVAQLLEVSPGVLLACDELLGFTGSFGKHKGGRGADLEWWLTIWSSRRLKVDRKTADRSIVVDVPVVSVIGGIQPHRLWKMRRLAESGDGFFDRFLWTYPEVVPVGQNEFVVSEETKKGLEELGDGLLGMRHRGPATVVTLSPGAKRVWYRWNNGPNLAWMRAGGRR